MSWLINMEWERRVQDMRKLGEHAGTETDEIDEEAYWKGFKEGWEEGWTQGQSEGYQKALEVSPK